MAANLQFGKHVLAEAERAGREALRALEQQGKAAAGEGIEALESWRHRCAELLNKHLAGDLNTLTLVRCLESEREALAFNLAAIASTYARSVLADVLGTALKFLSTIFGAGLAGLANITEAHHG